MFSRVRNLPLRSAARKRFSSLTALSLLRCLIFSNKTAVKFSATYGRSSKYSAVRLPVLLVVASRYLLMSKALKAKPERVLFTNTPASDAIGSSITTLYTTFYVRSSPNTTALAYSKTNSFSYISRSYRKRIISIGASLSVSFDRIFSTSYSSTDSAPLLRNRFPVRPRNYTYRRPITVTKAAKRIE